MALVEFTAVDHFVHELAREAPAEAGIESDIEERTRAMARAVDDFVRRYTPQPGMTAARKARHLAIVEGMAALISEKIDGLRANAQALSDPKWIDKAIEIHDDTVRHYWRLIALRSELDPECEPTVETMRTAEELNAWFDGISAG